MRRVETLPNIGPVLGARLRAVGLGSAGDFLAAGDRAAFTALVAAFPEDACTHSRLALAGAARGIRWHHLAPVDRAEALRDLAALQSAGQGR